MGTIKKEFQFGWLGKCDDMRSCASLSLNGPLSTADDGNDRSKVEAIIRVSYSENSNGRVFEKFTPYDNTRADLANAVDATDHTFDYFFNNNFQTLECGVGYIVTSRSFSDFDIENFHLADGTGYVSEGCADIQICTEVGLNTYQVSATQIISDQAAGIISTGWGYTGSVSLSGGDGSNTSIPTSVDITHNDQLIGHVTYTGNPSSDKIYISVTTGPLEGKCLVGTITNNLCDLKEK